MNQRLYFLTVAVLFAVLVSAEPTGYKDLTQEAPNPLQHKKFHFDSSCDGTENSNGTTAIACPAKTYPFALSLLDVEPKDISIGGEAVVLLRLTNVGHDPAIVPWGTNPDLIELPNENGSYEYLESNLTASLVSARGSARFRIPVSMYGTEEVEGTIKQINPGDSVEIRSKLALDCKSEERRCSLLSPGIAKLSFIWSEHRRGAIYEKCKIDYSSTRLRELLSDTAIVEIQENDASAW